MQVFLAQGGQLARIGTPFRRYVGEVVRPISGNVREEVSEAELRRVKLSRGQSGEIACRAGWGLGINLVVGGVIVVE